MEMLLSVRPEGELQLRRWVDTCGINHWRATVVFDRTAPVEGLAPYHSRWENAEIQDTLSSAFILKCDPAKIGPSIPSSNTFNFLFILCATLQAELKVVIWSDIYVDLNFIHLTSGFHLTKGHVDKTTLMDNEAVPKMKKKKKKKRKGTELQRQVKKQT